MSPEHDRLARATAMFLIGRFQGDGPSKPISTLIAILERCRREAAAPHDMEETAAAHDRLTVELMRTLNASLARLSDEVRSNTNAMLGRNVGGAISRVQEAFPDSTVNVKTNGSAEAVPDPLKKRRIVIIKKANGKRPRAQTIQAFVEPMIRDKTRTYPEIVKAVRERFPEAKTKAASLRWYARNLRKQGIRVPDRRRGGRPPK
jgi:hypothetical protein